MILSHTTDNIEDLYTFMKINKIDPVYLTVIWEEITDEEKNI